MGPGLKNRVRIIAGQWRGRMLTFPSSEGLRPTADRTRETLFNWLAPVLPGAACLDVFAGSGALGFEAASRGASRVVMLETDSQAVQGLRDNQQCLSATTVHIEQQDAVRFLTDTKETFDIVFLDPPFSDIALRDSTLCRLAEASCLKQGASIYLETCSTHEPLSVPEHWRLEKGKKAGQVDYRLYRVGGKTGPERNGT